MRAVINGQEFLHDPNMNIQNQSVRWYILGPPDGWIGIPDPRSDSDPIPGRTGGYTPKSHFYGSRTLAVQLAVTGQNSSIGRAAAEDWLASLEGNFSFLYEDEMGPRELPLVFQSAEPNYTFLSKRSSRFTVFLTAPDPIKYGTPVKFSMNETELENDGRTAVIPTRLYIGDPDLESGFAGSIPPGTGILFEVQDSDGDWHNIRWVNPSSATARRAYVNIRSMACYIEVPILGNYEWIDATSGVIEDDVIPLKQGVHKMKITPLDIPVVNTEHIGVEVRPGWL